MKEFFTSQKIIYPIEKQRIITGFHYLKALVLVGIPIAAKQILIRKKVQSNDKNP